ncbi:MAG: hypothetical protein E3K32_07155 [wastewater metagenome]|nr:hypothetical protein [Candidatus Loosdrechtia aerotolerans]
MSDIIERHEELSRRVLNPNKPISSEQKVSSQSKLVPAPFIRAFSLGAILGFSLFILIWILAGFSKAALTIPLIGGACSTGIEVVRQKNKSI